MYLRALRTCSVVRLRTTMPSVATTVHAVFAAWGNFSISTRHIAARGLQRTVRGSSRNDGTSVCDAGGFGFNQRVPALGPATSRSLFFREISFCSVRGSSALGPTRAPSASRM